MVIVLIATPSILLPGLTVDTLQIVALIALFAAGMTIFEYASTYPSLIEFRDAPPFNRIRFLSLFATVVVLSLICRGLYEPTALTEFLTKIGATVAAQIDAPFSPVRLMITMLPEGSEDQAQMLLIAAGLSYAMSFLSVIFFMFFLGFSRWPARSVFNVWVNLPTFDPTAGGDVIKRLNRDSYINVTLGVLLPFIVPVMIGGVAHVFDAFSLAHYQTMIWVVAAWAFIPASLFMRGLAMGRVAKLIMKKRRSAYPQGEEDGLVFA
nr:hypothetical protein [Pseudaestuariivita rosea]